MSSKKKKRMNSEGNLELHYAGIMHASRYEGSEGELEGLYGRNWAEKQNRRSIEEVDLIPVSARFKSKQWRRAWSYGLELLESLPGRKNS